MRFSVFATAFMATAAMATSTVYTTQEITITSCGATVTDCPARSTVTSTSTFPVVTTSSAPVYYNTTTLKTTAGVATSSDTVVTVTIDACTPTTVAPFSTGTGTVVPPKNATSVTTAAPTMFTGAASNLQGSVIFAAAAGLAAFAFA